MGIEIPTSTISTLGGYMTDIFGSFSSIIALIFGILLAFWIIEKLLNIFYTASYMTDINAKPKSQESVLYNPTTSPADLLLDYQKHFHNYQRDISALNDIYKIPEQYAIKFFISRGMKYAEAKKLTKNIYTGKYEEEIKSELGLTK